MTIQKRRRHDTDRASLSQVAYPGLGPGGIPAMIGRRRAESVPRSELSLLLAPVRCAAAAGMLAACLVARRAGSPRCLLFAGRVSQSLGSWACSIPTMARLALRIQWAASDDVCEALINGTKPSTDVTALPIWVWALPFDALMLFAENRPDLFVRPDSGQSPARSPPSAASTSGLSRQADILHRDRQTQGTAQGSPG